MFSCADVDGQLVGQFYKVTSFYLVTQSVFLGLLRMQGFEATLMVKLGLIRSFLAKIVSTPLHPFSNLCCSCHSTRDSLSYVVVSSDLSISMLNELCHAISYI